MASAQPLRDVSEYRICGYSKSNHGEAPAWFALQLRMHGKSFSIVVSESRFRNSPQRVLEFQEYFKYLTSDEDAFEDYEDNVSTGHVDEEGASPDAGGHDDTAECGGIAIGECFAWAVQPFIESFKSLAPKPAPASKITLQDFFKSESYECQLMSLDDHLCSGNIQSSDMDYSFVPQGQTIDGNPQRHESLASSGFPIFALPELEIVSDYPDTIFDDEPHRVCVHGQEYFFKSFEEVGEDLGRREIEKYEQIAKANFGSDVRTSRLFGIAQDEHFKIVGVLLYRIDEQTTLADAAVQPQTPESTKARWKEQVRKTLEALHQAGIIWGDAKADNVLVDMDGGAWIVDFGGGYTEGWVDKDNAGTIAGDLEGLGHIMHFIDTGSMA
ncbi:hypothetical protein QQS21_008624 [Conoideocrella luteorostrata]|uniref:Protein kinase domain-containing protein n=1 Tax=Conoideocrella luteorostrata TaxID=1105319 RepID=A0AAJ0FR22_9HYPO|nr:hypothetical protein QQS21_008624 [Conoideocrella luteorostrata]